MSGYLPVRRCPHSEVHGSPGRGDHHTSHSRTGQEGGKREGRGREERGRKGAEEDGREQKREGREQKREGGKRVEGGNERRNCLCPKLSVGCHPPGM